MKIGSLFSGYGGLDLAALQLFPGSRVVWHCEWEKAPSRILDHHWPGVPNLHDVTKVDWTQVEPIDVLTGGYPCQPFSAAGRRQGTEDERHLWPYVREAIRHLRPRFTLLENVAGHRSLGFDRVLGDLAEDGFDAEWTSVRASDIGAPHHRERLFILVVPSDSEGERLSGQQQPGRGAKEGPRVDGRLSSFSSHDYGHYAPAVRRWERINGEAPPPTELNGNGNRRLNAQFAEWMMGLPAGWVTGVPELSRAEQLKAIGNGVCPQQAVAAFSDLLAVADVA